MPAPLPLEAPATIGSLSNRQGAALPDQAADHLLFGSQLVGLLASRTLHPLEFLAGPPSVVLSCHCLGVQGVFCLFSGGLEHLLYSSRSWGCGRAAGGRSRAAAGRPLLGSIRSSAWLMA